METKGWSFSPGCVTRECQNQESNPDPLTPCLVSSPLNHAVLRAEVALLFGYLGYSCQDSDLQWGRSENPKKLVCDSCNVTLFTSRWELQCFFSFPSGTAPLCWVHRSISFLRSLRVKFSLFYLPPVSIFFFFFSSAVFFSPESFSICQVTFQPLIAVLFLLALLSILFLLSHSHPNDHLPPFQRVFRWVWETEPQKELS